MTELKNQKKEKEQTQFENQSNFYRGFGRGKGCKDRGSKK